jgi:hemolysin III
MDKMFDKDFVSKAIYGLISVLAVLLIMEEHPPTAWKAAGILFGTVLALAMAETYSAAIAETIAGQRRLDRQEIMEIWHDTRPILLTANLPTLVILLSGAGLYSMQAALIIARSAIYLTLFVFGLQVGHLFHASRWRIWLSGLFTAGIGVLIGLMKFLLHW